MSWEERRRAADAPPGSRQEQLCYIKTFIQDLRVCECIENIDKIFVLRSFSPSSRSLLYSLVVLSFRSSMFRRSGRMVPNDPSFRTNRRVSIVERSTRHASSRDACDVNEGRFLFLLFRTLIRRESALAYNRRFNFIKILFLFFLLINMLCLAYRVIKVSRKMHSPPFLKKHSFPLAPVPSFACSFLSFFPYFLSSFAR